MFIRVHSLWIACQRHLPAMPLCSSTSLVLELLSFARLVVDVVRPCCIFQHTFSMYGRRSSYQKVIMKGEIGAKAWLRDRLESLGWCSLQLVPQGLGILLKTTITNENPS